MKKSKTIKTPKTLKINGDSITLSSSFILSTFLLCMINYYRKKIFNYIELIELLSKDGRNRSVDLLFLASAAMVEPPYRTRWLFIWIFEKPNRIKFALVDTDI